MPIYTRTGDKGTTSLFDKTRVLKSHDRVETYGTIDELNSTIGAAIAYLRRSKKQELRIKEELEKVQHDLLEIGSALANPKALPVKGLDMRPTDFEKLIDKMTARIPELKNFILPGGSKAGSLLHVARTIARRAERRIVHLIQAEDIDQDVVIYVNRLSDLLFTMARFVNHQEKKKETKWIKKV
ncbi:MAG TPA: cob(I)yrinic acid a,c-diamide adenosyltransferase [Candidatus Limnocylindrales bacterium]|nr:cob(I)yrinic acid a,c-diamide adenosyltransferase [Candidatus Limnocylindrales bacterium]